ncbi:MAG: hypothetical protein PHI31_12890 [Desulfuromonadaceae bacterium]|nr:hypothetical protein [Desulfuromonadaceae bacterium]
MSNLLLITDVARLRKIFGRLTEDKNIRLRVVNNLEKGGEEIAIEKPDVVFVQTHLSGLSADILLMHLKKQLGRKRTRFVLLATPPQTSTAILKPYHGWLDTSAEDGPLLSELQRLLQTLLSRPKKHEPPAPEQIEVTDPARNPEPVAIAGTDPQFPVVTPPAPEPTLEELGVTYSPRQRLKVYSEFNSSFDSAVSSTPDAEPLEQATPVLPHDWHAGSIDTVESNPVRSKRGTFLLWLVPVVIVVVAVTYLQQQKTSEKPLPAVSKAPPATAVQSVTQPAPPSPPVALPVVDTAKVPVTPRVAPSVTQERMSDKAMLTAMAEKHGSKSRTAAPPSAGVRLTSLPDYIPRYGFDKQYGAANPGWERYKGQVTEFKVLREAEKIKAIQVIDRGGNGIPESFMKAVIRQSAVKPVASIDSSEKKDGYEVQRGRLADNISVVYYRDEEGGRLRAMVLTWH